jgi:pimeloyl-ACP methyl ester carboxylesterase
MTDPAPRCVYLHGFASSPGSAKARLIGGRLAARGWDVAVPDLNAGDFSHLTVGRMLAQVRPLLGADGEPPVWLVGSSLGGWTSALLAAERPGRLRGLVLLAPAFGMVERWRARLTTAEVAAWEREGLEVFHHGEQRKLRLDIGFLHDAGTHAPYPEVSARVPTLIIHGVNDDVVPVEVSRRFAMGRAHVELRELPSDHELTDVLEPVWSLVAAHLGW